MELLQVETQLNIMSDHVVNSKNKDHHRIEHIKEMYDIEGLHNWDVIWRRTIIDHASKFIKSNSSELIDVYLAFAPEKGFSYPDYLSHASKNLDNAKLFWVGGQGYMVKGMSKEESLKEKGIVDKIETVHGSNHQLVKKAKKALFHMTKNYLTWQRSTLPTIFWISLYWVRKTRHMIIMNT